MLQLDFGAWRKLTVTISSRLAIALLVSAVSSAIAAAITLFSLMYDRDVALSRANSEFAQSVDAVALEVDHILDPIERVLDGMQASLDPIGANALSSDAILRYLLGRIRGVDYVARLYFANVTGDYAIISKMSEDSEAFEGPPGVPAYVGRWVKNDGRQRFIERRYVFDGYGLLLGVDDRFSSAIDIRDSDWYQVALQNDGITHADTQLLPDSPNVGITISVAIPSGGVVAADITLASIGVGLQRHRLTPGFRSILFEYPGTITASAELDWVVGEDRIEGRSTRYRAQTLADIDSPGVAALSIEMARGFRDGLRFVTSPDGRRWAIWLRQLSGGVFDNHFLASFVDTKELYVDADRQFNVSVMIGAVGVLVGILLALWLSAGISSPIARTVREVERLTDFDLDTHGDERPSFIDELGILHGSVVALRTALRNFAIYVPRQLAQRLVAGKVLAEISGQRQDVTVLFTDIENFTAISESLDADTLTRDISDYLGLVSETLMDGHATVDKFIGDAVMAFWNAPEEIENHAEAACLATLRARAAIHAFNEDRVRRGQPRFRTRFGLHSGMAVVGTIGSQERANYTVVGATVNLASRIEGINKLFGTEILISADVRARLGAQFAVRPIDLVQAKGTTNAIQLYELMGCWSEDPHLAPNPECKLMVGSWLAAVEHYTARNWDLAIAALDDHLIFWPEDGAAHELRRRSQAYRQFPPPADWDGIEKLYSK